MTYETIAEYNEEADNYTCECTNCGKQESGMIFRGTLCNQSGWLASWVPPITPEAMPGRHLRFTFCSPECLETYYSEWLNGQEAEAMRQSYPVPGVKDLGELWINTLMGRSQGRKKVHTSNADCLECGSQDTSYFSPLLWSEESEDVMGVFFCSECAAIELALPEEERHWFLEPKRDSSPEDENENQEE